MRILLHSIEHKKNLAQISLSQTFAVLEMEETQEIQLHVMTQEGKEIEEGKDVNSSEQASTLGESSVLQQTRNYKWWILISIYTAFVLFGQAVSMILGRLYFVKGGSSKWMATLVQLCGFPILIPYYFIFKMRNRSPNDPDNPIKPPSKKKLGSVYLSVGLLVAINCFLYSVGQQYLPVSTYTLICASQLAFNSLFSYLFNLLEFTPLIINSLVLLTISSVLLVFSNESSDDTTGVSKGKYAIGFICTVAASAGYGLVMSLVQLSFKKVIKRRTLKQVVEMIICQQITATFAVLVGLFGSGDWNGLTKEMNVYKLGKVSYVMTLVWTAISWQVFGIGGVGLIFEVSSLFSNAIMVVGLPIVPVAAVFVFHDKMDGVKAISMVLAIWGFISFVYQHYLYDRDSKAGIENANSATIYSSHGES